MSIFESLGNLNVSEECFDDIIAMIEELTNREYRLAVAADNSIKQREKEEGRADMKVQGLENTKKPKDMSRREFAESDPEIKKAYADRHRAIKRLNHAYDIKNEFWKKKNKETEEFFRNHKD